MVEIKLYDAPSLNQAEWRQLQGISRDAFAHTLNNRTPDEIDTLVRWDDPAGCYASHVDPNLQVGTLYNPDQSYSRPRVAVALQAGQPIGFAFSAHNVSGASGRERFVKRLGHA